MKEIRPTIRGLQAGRAIAALAVVFHHAGQSTDAFVAPLPPLVEYLAQQGAYGVDFFFVLSGFIIYWTTVDLDCTSATARRFARRRFTRIFVSYWPIGVGLALAYILLPSLSEGNRDWSWLSTLTLLPSGSPPALSVAWTLQHELLFYGLFGLLLWGRIVWPGIAVWAFGILALAGLASEPHWLAAFVFNPLNLEFIFGVAAAQFVRHPTALWRPLVAVGAATVVVGLILPGRILIGLVLALTVVVLVRAEQARRIWVATWLVTLGEASYAIYLIHNPVLSLVSRLIGRATDAWLPALLVEAIIAAAIGLLYYFMWEIPTLRLIRSRLNRPPVAAHI